MYLPVSWKQPVSWLTALPAMNGFSRGSSHDCSRGQSSRSDARQAGLDAATVCTLLAIFGVTTGARLDVLAARDGLVCMQRDAVGSVAGLLHLLAVSGPVSAPEQTGSYC